MRCERRPANRIEGTDSGQRDHWPITAPPDGKVQDSNACRFREGFLLRLDCQNRTGSHFDDDAVGKVDRSGGQPPKRNGQASSSAAETNA